MRRKIALLTEYDGTRYCGWQWQKNAMSIQEKLTQALQKVLDQPICLCGCSRTDSGVHARGHVSHFWMTHSIPAERLPLALLHALPQDIVVRKAADVDPSFHARYDAQRKQYSYRIWNDRLPSALGHRYMAHIPQKLDLSLMREAANLFIGTNDFRAYMAAGGQVKSTIRRIDRVDLIPADQTLTFIVEGNGFLYNMVRIMVGTLVYIGQGKLEPRSIIESFKTGRRQIVGITMPPEGLCLEHVWYQKPVFDERGRLDDME